LRYQPEIDGLRTIAITAAVFFHAGVPGFGGGFVGVDVFFVISGFLITRMLLTELMHTGKIEFFTFYARRVRRLLPALIAVILVVLLLGTFVLTPAGEQQDLSISAGATVAFLSNVYFWRTQAPYLADFSNEWVPLLHAWTLSVEEQFYILWPATLLVTAYIFHKIRVGSLLGILLLFAALFVISFSLSWWGTLSKPVATFYLMPTRGWEFVLGSMVALAAKPLATRLRYTAAPLILAGLAAIVVTIATLNEQVPYPGIAALLPTLGTAAVIAGTLAAPQPFIIKVLQAAPMVVVGKLSYSWYLWHWPLLVLVRIHNMGTKNLVRDLFVITASFGLAALTYVFVENPIRRQKPWPFSDVRKTLASGFVLSCGIAGLALVLYIRADAAASRDPDLAAIYSARSEQTDLPRSCHSFGRFTGLAPADTCLVGAVRQPKRILVWGDSHAQHFLPMLAEHGDQNGYSTVARTMGGCPPLVKASVDGVLDRDCFEFNAAVAKEVPVLAQTGIKGIVLASRYFGFSATQFSPDDGDHAEVAKIKNSGSAQSQVWQQYLRQTLSIAQNARLKVLLIAPVPYFSLPVPLCLAHHTLEKCTRDRIPIERQRVLLIEALQRTVAEFDNVRLWDPFDVLCDERICAPVHSHLVLYSDRHHLSIDGSRYLATFATPQLNWLIH
jgi:peptidoglycan/LPS O-acetylase OafA/YrhL